MNMPKAERIAYIEGSKSNKRDYRRVKTTLYKAQKVNLAKLWIRGKEHVKNLQVINAKEKTKKAFSLETNTADITSFLSSSVPFEQRT